MVTINNELNSPNSQAYHHHQVGITDSVIF